MLLKYLQGSRKDYSPKNELFLQGDIKWLNVLSVCICWDTQKHHQGCCWWKILAMSSIFFSKQLYFIMPLCDSVICNHGGSSVTVMTQQRVTQYLSMSLADPVCHEILYNTRSCEVAFRIKIKCSCQISLFLPHCKLWRITSLGHKHIFWKHPRFHFCVALLL